MRRPRRQSSSGKIWWLAGALLLLALPVVGVVYVVLADWRPLAERKASEALGRPVTIGELHLGWGRRLRLEARDLRIANVPGGDAPDMISIKHLTARIDLSALVREEMRYEQLALDGVEIVLERKDDGARNWRFGDGEASAPSTVPSTTGGLALVPKNRRQFPTLLDMTAHDAVILYRSEGRKDIRIALNDLGLGASDASSPTRLTVKGAYNELPIDLVVDGGSFTEMRKGDMPYPAAFTATSGGTKIVFKGTLTEPLDFEGARGRLDLAIADFAAFLKMFGYERPLAFPVMLAGDFARDGDRWALSQTQGTFGDSKIAGSFVFTEGARGRPDAATVDVTLDQFDLKTFTQGIAEPSGSGGSSFRPEAALSTTLDARIAAKIVRFGDVAFDDVRLRGRMLPGEITTDELSLGFAGGRITSDGSLRAAGADGAARVQVAYANADVARLAKMAGLDDGLLSGALDGRISLAMTGPTLQTALAASEGQAVLAMKGGEISRSLLEKVSVDLRSIFRRNSQSTAIQCLLVVADIQKGNARILPLTLRTPDTRLIGGGALDMPSGQLDLLVRSDPKTTGSLALDLPLHVTGPLDNPSVSPRLGGAPAWLAQPQALPASLDARARALAAETGCAP
jgi:uncharacterized protein involved in outer membrane biogenesis